MHIIVSGISDQDLRSGPEKKSLKSHSLHPDLINVCHAILKDQKETPYTWQFPLVSYIGQAQISVEKLASPEERVCVAQQFQHSEQGVKP